MLSSSQRKQQSRRSKKLRKSTFSALRFMSTMCLSFFVIVCVFGGGEEEGTLGVGGLMKGVAAADSPNNADTSSVYTKGDLILANPTEATTIFLTVLLISGTLEFCIDTAADVKNKYFRVMFAALSQEVMIIGVLVLLLTFAETVYDWPDRWILIFKWSMMCLFLMIICFVLLVLIMLGVVTKSDHRWRDFESIKMDSGQALSLRERQYKRCFDKFQTALSAFGYDSSQGIMFSLYLSKLQRKNVVSLTDLTWVSWVCLATLVILNAIRAEVTRRASQLTDENLEDQMTIGQRAGNYVSFIVFIGYLTMGVFLIMYFVLSSRLNKYLGMDRDDNRDVAVQQQLKKISGGNRGGKEDPLLGQDALDDSRSFLFRRSQDATLEMVQVIILAFEWYLAAFFLSFAYQIVTNLGYWAIPIMIAAVFPLIVFSLLLPWMITMITMLGSLGNNLQEPVVQKLLLKSGIPEEELPGRMRRKLRRQQGIADDEPTGTNAGGTERDRLNSTVAGTTLPDLGKSLSEFPAASSFASPSNRGGQTVI